MNDSFEASLDDASGGVGMKAVVLEGPDAGLERRLTGTLTVGTDPKCELVLHDPTVSRRHFMMAALAGRVGLRDLGSTNGTWVAGQRAVEVQLAPGTVIRAGSTLIAAHPAWYVRELPLSPHRQFGRLFGKSALMREAFAILERVAPSDVTVLIEGESGTGKELAARSIHEASPRHQKPYVVFDCAQTKPDLIESELFGHKRGAFTGAVTERRGVFQQANGGSLFIDEIGELPMSVQATLLRTLETGEVKPVGADQSVVVDARVIAATNRDLKAEVERGNFRSDLFYRLEVVKLRLPPLRKRPEDIAGIIEMLLAGRIDPDSPIAGSNLQRCLSHSWPGNVRELRNALERAVALAPRDGDRLPKFDELVVSVGQRSERPSTLQFPGLEPLLPYKDAKQRLLEDFERAYVKQLLLLHGGQISAAAEAAGLSRKHVYELLRRTGLQLEPGRV